MSLDLVFRGCEYYPLRKRQPRQRLDIEDGLELPHRHRFQTQPQRGGQGGMGLIAPPLAQGLGPGGAAYGCCMSLKRKGKDRWM
jgi:hypothetical protein